jgi:hypothetical protein
MGYNLTRRISQINPDEQASHFRELVTLISRNYICVRCADPANQISSTGCAVLSCGDLRVFFPPVLPALGELQLPFVRYSPQPHTESGDAQEQGLSIP